MAKRTLPNSTMTDASEEFESMYKVNEPLIYRFMLWRTKDSMLAEDLTSSVFEKAWRSRHSFKGGSAKAWLHKIARNTLIDHWRKRQDINDETAVLSVASEAPALGETFDRQLLVNSLQQAVAKLPAEMRLVVNLRFIKGLSVRQTGQELGLSEANVRVIQYRALRKLRGYLE